MAGAIHKMAVYLGLVEDEMAYDDGYDSFEEEYAGYEDEESAASGSARQVTSDHAGYETDPAEPDPVRQTEGPDSREGLLQPELGGSGEGAQRQPDGPVPGSPSRRRESRTGLWG